MKPKWVLAQQGWQTSKPHFLFSIRMVGAKEALGLFQGVSWMETSSEQPALLLAQGPTDRCSIVFASLSCQTETRWALAQQLSSHLGYLHPIPLLSIPASNWSTPSEAADHGCCSWGSCLHWVADFSLTQPWLCQALGSEPAGGRSLSTLSPSPSLSSKLKKEEISWVKLILPRNKDLLAISNHLTHQACILSGGTVGYFLHLSPGGCLPNV